jgi:dTDP-4-dehydrorhamnose reductase
MKITVFGNGFLGNRLVKDLGASLSYADITNKDKVRQELKENQTAVVINAAGKTGKPNVDWCETHRTETFQSNVIGALTLASVCEELGVHLVHLGSGCIFYGECLGHLSWEEEDFANPTSFYSRTKYAADLVLSRLENVSILRLRMPIDSVPGPRNLITKLAGYKKIIDVENSVTIVDDLVEVTRQIIERKLTGIFHVTNPGTLRHRDLMSMYRTIVDPRHTCEFINVSELVSSGLALKDRSNCILSSRKLQDAGIHMRPLEEALPDVMEKYRVNLE